MKVGRGFTLIELLIVLAILGLAVAVALPGMLGAASRRKQTRTLADIRVIAAAVEEHAVDNSLYPAAGWVTMGTLVSAATLRTPLEPTYIRQLPTTDGWKNTLYYFGDGGYAYQLASYGRDGALTAGAYGPTTNFNDDIVFESGRFTVWPEGVQD